MEEIPFDPRRRLCPDGACVGLIGADGLCSVCRRPAGAAASWTSDVETGGSERDDGDDGASMSPSDAPAPTSPPSSNASSGFDAKRRLCDDGSCVGIVGADGVCGTCGRKAD
jgi:hypothetical protein